MSKEERKEDFIQFLITETVRLGKKLNIDEIRQYADSIDYAFNELQIGGKATKKKTRHATKKKTTSHHHATKKKKNNTIKKKKSHSIKKKTRNAIKKKPRKTIKKNN